MGTYPNPKAEGSENTSATNVAEYSVIEQTLFFYNLRKEEFIIQLALKMTIKGMSIQAIADTLEVQPVTGE